MGHEPNDDTDADDHNGEDDTVLTKLLNVPWSSMCDTITEFGCVIL